MLSYATLTNIAKYSQLLPFQTKYILEYRCLTELNVEYTISTKFKILNFFLFLDSENQRFIIS